MSYNSWRGLRSYYIKVYSNWVNHYPDGTAIGPDEPYSIACDDRKNN
ncbi:TPA: hypothetical protein N2D87_000449 [Clostridium botulinum]|nr:hypothetical protein [Clostridium botulinum]HCL4436731.1 hypothetical protein [Clostridium botulinum]HCL4450018.1 hypothetical protein [Clostridium botulinum]HCL4452522.1 hypothetical protein [Clostridium botulinum]HCL4464366.1 hypothetical protein [Clostridium botulinum]HCL4468183.1 hypothetical protein [Clostridium botulinum]